MNEDQMVQGCIDGNAITQRNLYDRFSGKMMGVCLRYTTYSEDAQDILQDGFVKVFTKIDSYNQSGSLEGWIRRIMVNTALEWLRKNKALQETLNMDDLQVIHVGYNETASETHANDLLEMVNKLPAGYRSIFNLYAIDGYNHVEIAEMLDISVGTSKSQYARARRLLQKMLSKDQVE